jgi:hypothetical protein
VSDRAANAGRGREEASLVAVGEARPLNFVSASVVVDGDDVGMACAVVASEVSVLAAAGDAATIGGVGASTCVEAASVFGGDTLACFGEEGDWALDGDFGEAGECCSAVWSGCRLCAWGTFLPTDLAEDTRRGPASRSPGPETEMHSSEAQPLGALIWIVRPATSNEYMVPACAEVVSNIRVARE